METLNIIIATLLVYSSVATAAYIASKENDDVICAFGFGIVGLTLICIMEIIRKVIFKCKYRIGKRSIFEETSTGNKYICKSKDTDDINYHVEGYKLIKRYASKSEWKDIPYFDKEFIENAKRNCDHCKYDYECQRHEPKCRHDIFGMVLEFDKFEKGKAE